ncbi:MAG TPA: hypothetical protein VMN57_15375 [Anaerolineales bacterium]|nr:hypothetical protein [Anaerolineales bacterium]
MGDKYAWLPHAAAAAGFAVYLALAWHHSRTQASVIDEGMYLYKGWLFATGRYIPYQDFGPWTNHMPLSFLLPGWVQLLLGPGLRTGRLLALFTGALSVTGLWTLARRFGSAWWAAAAVWVVALNPALIKIYSIQASQGLAACILIWALVFTLGTGRRNWEVALGGALAGALALTRINLAPFLPLLAAYAFAAHGRRTGIVFAAAGMGIFTAGHAAYWPGILRLWAPWFPEALTPFLDSFRRPANDGGLWAPEVDWRGRVASFLQGLRFHLLPISAVVTALAFWPARDSGWSRSRRTAALLLLALFGLLFAMHAWASLGQNYCVFCFPVYLSFFSLPALLLLPLTYPVWNPRRDRVLAAGAVLIAATVLGAGAAGLVGPRLMDQPSAVRLLRTEVPRTAGPGTIPLWGLIENVTGREYDSIVRSTLLAGRAVLAGGIGLAAGLAVLALARRLPDSGRPFAHRAGVCFLALGLVFSPTPFLAGGYAAYDCSGDVAAGYEQVGAELAGLVPPGGRIFWWTGGSPGALLYLPEAGIFPAQLNGAYSFKFGGDPEALARYGHWNRSLAEDWLREADAVLTSDDVLQGAETGWLLDSIVAAGFTPAAGTSPVHPCDLGSEIIVFLKKR